jgi:hypothetical protein
MAVSRQMIGMIGVVLACLGPGVSKALPQEVAPAQSVEIPAGAAALEGIPTVRIDSTQQGTTRRVLGEAEARKDRLTVSQVNGKYYWTSRENKLLQLNPSGPYTYLSSEPGKYIRFTRINDRISYVEHVDSALGSVTWWGELRIVGGKR